MTSEQGFKLVTRAVALYLLVWALSDIVGFPQYVLSFAYHLRLFRSGRADNLIGGDIYWVRYYGIGLIQEVIRILAFLWAAGWFYRGAPGVRRFFFDGEATSETSSEGHPLA